MRPIASVVWLFALACAAPPQPAQKSGTDQMAVVVTSPSDQTVDPGAAYAELMADTGSASKQMAYFRSFPADFRGLKDSFGYDEVNEDSVLFGTYYEQGELMIAAFFTLRSVPVHAVAAKAVGIARTGSWQADGISHFRAGLTSLFERDPEVVLAAINDLAGPDQIGFWRFFIDGPVAFPKAEVPRLRSVLAKEFRQLAIVDSLLALPQVPH